MVIRYHPSPCIYIILLLLHLICLSNQWKVLKPYPLHSPTTLYLLSPPVGWVSLYDHGWKIHSSIHQREFHPLFAPQFTTSHGHLLSQIPLQGKIHTCFDRKCYISFWLNIGSFLESTVQFSFGLYTEIYLVKLLFVASCERLRN